MKIVQPIRDPNQIMALRDLLKSKNIKYYILLVIGLNTGLRVSDILTLKVKDVIDKTHVSLIEKKTGKTKRFLINTQLREEIDQHIQASNLQLEDYLIQSRKGLNMPLRREQAYKILNSAAKEIGIDDIGSHSMRKTFGYWHYKCHKDLAILQDIFNHSSQSVTLRYIGINDDMKDETLKDFFL